jgi:hypothetical protein
MYHIRLAIVLFTEINAIINFLLAMFAKCRTCTCSGPIRKHVHSILVYVIL